MEVYKIYTKKSNTTCNYIKVTKSLDKALYTYYVNGNEKKSSFNKYAFIEYLKSINIPKKYINAID
jgi:hypothetical protein